jgi:hypothetical protein
LLQINLANTNFPAILFLINISSSSKTSTSKADMAYKQSADSCTLNTQDNNPFIVGLPEKLDGKQFLSTINKNPSFINEEKNYPSHLRRHCILRLINYFDPVSWQLDAANIIDSMIRQGYMIRNPLDLSYMHQLQDGANRIEMKSLHITPQFKVGNKSKCFLFTGMSGIGKSYITSIVINQYPQLITHHFPNAMVQVVWLKLDCPMGGTPKELCISFFNMLDELLGTRYVDWYQARKASVDDLMVRMAHVATLHALGLLLIDEIHRVNSANTGPESLLRFVAILATVIGIPVVIIGEVELTPHLMNYSYHNQAITIEPFHCPRMLNNYEWEAFVNHLWQYQWTREFTHLDHKIINVLHDETAGILDLLIRLFILAQMRLITINETRGSPEILTPELLHTVSQNEFKLMRQKLLFIGDKKYRATIHDSNAL